MAQIGSGEFIPIHIRHVRFFTEAAQAKAYDWADIIISTGGFETIRETIIRRKKRVILVWMRPWSPQAFRPFIDGNHVLYCQNLDDLPKIIEMAKTFEFIPYIPDRFDITPILEEMEESTKGMHPVERFCGGIAIFCITILLIIIVSLFLWR